MNLNKLVEHVFKKNLSGLRLLASALRKNSSQSTRQFHLTSINSDDVNLNFESRELKPRSTSRYTERTCTCGELRPQNAGQNVTLCGWLEFQRMHKFVVLRDGYGQTQLMIRQNDTKAQHLLGNLPYESIVKVKGTVELRPPNMINKNQATGEIEVVIDEVSVLNPSTNKLPFNIREYQKAREALRMQYRYLDLRFPQMQRNLRTRSRVLMDIREFLTNVADFVDVETPTLFKATPGGAQEFIVPTRFPGQFYSLVQSPQQFKQMLMAGGIDRYFQIARCYRDEGSRSDRQPEFSQLDIEMSFTDTDGVIGVVEDLLRYAWPDFLGRLPDTFPRITFDEAMQKYGSDKPDLRFGFELQDCTDILKADKGLITKDFHGSYLVFEKPVTAYNFNPMINKLVDISRSFPFTNLIACRSDKWVEHAKAFLRKDVAESIHKRCSSVNKDAIIILAYGQKMQTLSLLGKIRTEYVNFLEQDGIIIKENKMMPLWVVDFPLFEEGDSPGRLASAHHPFTAPHPEDLNKLDSKPLQVRALSYDLVLNGSEVGGGSIRIHDPKLQEKVFKMLNIDKNSMHHMLEMLASGCPPHGGIALGLDRLLSVMLGTQSIRDVIAFPKTFEGRDPVSGAPSPISENDKKIYHIRTVPEGYERMN